MNLLSVSTLILSLASFAGAEDQPKTIVKTEASSTRPAISSNQIYEVIAKDATIAANDHAFVNKDEMVLVQGQHRFVIPAKSITGVSYSVVNIVSISVSPSSRKQVPRPRLVKTNDYFVGITWTDKSDTSSGVVLKVGTDEYGALMTALKGLSIKAVNSDMLSFIQ